jgi:hypothetical protein
VEIAVVNSNHNGHKKEACGERHDYLAANCLGKKWKFAKQCYLLCTLMKTGILIKRVSQCFASGLNENSF